MKKQHQLQIRKTKKKQIKILDKGIIYTPSLGAVLKALKKIKPYKRKPRNKNNKIWQRLKKKIQWKN